MKQTMCHALSFIPSPPAIPMSMKGAHRDRMSREQPEEFQLHDFGWPEGRTIVRGQDFLAEAWAAEKTRCRDRERFGKRVRHDVFLG